MRPISFKHANRTLGPPTKQDYSENVMGIAPLPVWSDGEQCVSCWQMSWRERLSALLFGRVWIALLSGETQPPASAQVSQEYLTEAT